MEREARGRNGVENSPCDVGSNQRSEVAEFLSPEVLMDAWETGQQLARRWGASSVRALVESSRGSAPYGYRWWRSQGALAYVGTKALHSERRRTGSQGSGHGDGSRMGSGNGS